MLIPIILFFFLPLVFGLCGGAFFPRKAYRVLLGLAAAAVLVGIGITVVPMLLPSGGHVPPDEQFADGFMRLMKSAAAVVSGLSLGLGAIAGRAFVH